MSDQRGRQPGRRQDGVVERRVVVDEQGARLIVPPRVISLTPAWSSVIPPWAWAGEVAASTVDRQVLGPVADPGAEAPDCPAGSPSTSTRPLTRWAPGPGLVLVMGGGLLAAKAARSLFAGRA